MKKLTFEGNGLRVVDFRGEPMVIAKDLGAVLGYSKDGRRLVSRISEEWAAEQWPVQCDVEKNPDGSVTSRPKL